MKRKQKSPEIPLNILAIISVAAAVLLLIVIFKFKGGILGMVLGAIVVAVLIYWLREMNKIVGEERAYPTSEAEWFYDLIDKGESIVLTANVPGPPEDVKVELHEGLLEIRGGGGFTQRVEVPKEAKIKDKSYINGVLHVSLQRLKGSRSLKKLIKEWT